MDTWHRLNQIWQLSCTKDLAGDPASGNALWVQSVTVVAIFPVRQWSGASRENG